MVYLSVLARGPSVTGHELESTKPKSPDNQAYNNRGLVRYAHSVSTPRVNPKKCCLSIGYAVLCTEDKIQQHLCRSYDCKTYALPVGVDARDSRV